MEPWIEWVRRLQAIADTGLQYASSSYDRARYEELRAFAREVREEAGIAVHAVKLVAVHDRDRRNHPAHIHHIYKLIFACERLDDRQAASDDEVDAVDWFKLEDLPPLSTGRTTRGQIELALVHHERPDLPTEFD